MSEKQWGKMAEKRKKIKAFQLFKEFLRRASIQGALQMPVEVKNVYHHDGNNSVEAPKRIEVKIDPIIFHTIQLLGHRRKMKTLVSSVQQKVSESEGGKQMLPLPPPIPEVSECILEQRPGDISRLNHDSDFARGIGTPPPSLSRLTAHNVLRRSVGCLCAHVGFFYASDVVLEVFSDVAEDFCRRVCSCLQRNVDTGAAAEHLGFVDILEQTFHDLGLGSITTLNSFYQNRVIGYHNYILNSCRELMKTYKELQDTGLLAEEKSAVNEDGDSASTRGSEVDNGRWISCATVTGTDYFCASEDSSDDSDLESSGTPPKRKKM